MREAASFFKVSTMTCLAPPLASILASHIDATTPSAPTEALELDAPAAFDDEAPGAGELVPDFFTAR